MNKKKKFVTIFPSTENIHLIKDVGIIPYLMHKNHHYDSYIASYNNGNYDYLQTDVSGLKVVFLNKIFKNDFLNILMFIVTFKKIDVLQLYHYSFERLILCFLFKLITFGRGKTYIKLDANEKILTTKYSGFKKILNKFFVKFVDLISAETRIITNLLNTDNILDHKVEFIPNGFIKSNNEVSVKKNKFITVGRIGDINKNNKLLLNAIKIINLKDWKVEFIGPIDDTFIPVISQFYEENDHLKDKVLFTGNISDRSALNKIYSEAKVFVLTSRSEGFPLVFLEAISNGCFLVSTNITAAQEVSNNQRYGSLFQSDNVNELAKILQQIIDKELTLISAQEISKFATNNYYWPNIVDKLQKLLQN